VVRENVASCSRTKLACYRRVNTMNA
jgi:hypothetical protein